MEKTPIIFFAFANDVDAHLPLLKEEVRLLFNELEEYDRHEYLKIHRKENANLKDVFEGFTRYKDQIVIFHYGGHAGGSGLQLQDGGGKADGLAQLIGEQENLQLVFLNGCATRDQVKLLFAAGVKAVIATSVKIKDNLAVEFAQQFYNSLVNRRTIGQAFGIAEAYLKARPDTAELLTHFRGFESFSENALDASDDIAWALYVNPDKEKEVMHWQLPYYKPVKFSSNMVTYITDRFPSNQFIVRYVLQEMCRYNPDIYADLEEQQGDSKRKVDSSQYPWIIIENFPWPIGAQISELFKKENTSPNQARLEHLVSCYIITSKVLYYILQSDLWEKSRGAGTKSTWKHKKLSKSDYAKFDFLGELKNVFDAIREIDVPFVPEFSRLINQLENSGLKSAHKYLEELRSGILSSKPVEDLKKTCLQAEQALANLLMSASFLSKYRMLTVRDVSVERQRFAVETYDLDMGRLNASDSNRLSLYNDPASRKKPTYTDSDSVVMVVNEDKIDNALNLSPLIIDKNTFARVKKSETTSQDKIPHIFLSSWYEKGKLYYIDIRHNFFSAMKKSSDQIHTEMTDADFKEGSNIEESEMEQLDFMLEMDTEEKTEGNKVFQLLHEQYEMFHADMK